MGITIRYRASRERWVVTEVNQGQRHQLTFKDEGEAKEYAAKRTTELNEAEFHGVRMGRRPKRTFLEGLEKWIEEYDIRPGMTSVADGPSRGAVYQDDLTSHCPSQTRAES